MKAAIYLNHAEHQKTHAAWMAEGMRRHGLTVEFSGYNEPIPADIHVMWGWRQDRVIGAGGRVLVMERGHVQPRMEWTSIGWGGILRNAMYPKASDGGERWRRHFGDYEKPWRLKPGPVLICGQSEGDIAIAGLDQKFWANSICEDLRSRGHLVAYRPHPNMVTRNNLWHPAGAALAVGPLDEDLEIASAVVAYCSTASVESVLAGVPTVTTSPSAMAWPVASHTLLNLMHTPERREWMSSLAWTQWRPSEIASGEAWAAVRTCMPE
jgi:hypothetical protein